MLQMLDALARNKYTRFEKFTSFAGQVLHDYHMQQMEQFIAGELEDGENDQERLRALVRERLRKEPLRYNYWCEEPLPLLLEHQIQTGCGRKACIEDVFEDRIRRQAEEVNKSFDELYDDVRFTYGFKGTHYLIRMKEKKAEQEKEDQEMIRILEYLQQSDPEQSEHEEEEKHAELLDEY